MRPQISISMCSSSNARAPAHITQPYLHTYAGAGARARALTEGATAQRVASPCPDDAFHVTLCILCIQIFELGISHARRSVACVRVCVCVCAKSHTALHSITGPSSACASPPLPLRPPAHFAMRNAERAQRSPFHRVRPARAAHTV